MRDDFVIKEGGDAGRLASEVAEIVFNPEVSDYEYFLSRKRYFARLEAEKSSSDHEYPKSDGSTGVSRKDSVPQGRSVGDNKGGAA